jgi:hypothetical protein
MNLVRAPDGLRLEHQGRSILLDDRDRLHLTRMTPMGRKVYFRRKGKIIRDAGREDPEADLLLSWSRMPAREWAFPVPD